MDVVDVYQVSAEGSVNVPTYSRITMINKDAVTDSSLTFNYEITGAYQ